MKNRKEEKTLDGSATLRRLFLTVCLALWAAIGVYAQNKTVTGTVVDAASGEAVIGASVLVDGTTNGTITNLDGHFTLNNVPTNATLKVTYVGYADQMVSVAGRTNVTVTLQEDSELIDEVVVVGYGTQRKSDVTGAISRVTSQELTNRPVNNALEALQGKTAGVDIRTNERPGQLAEIYIRGRRSLTAGSEPLYVVDGIPLSSGGIENINPRDIETIDILKDASAAAIYGNQGANGVVIITTKKGKEGKMTLNYSGTLTLSNIVDKDPSMNASDFINFKRWAAYNLDPTKFAHPDSPTRDSDMIVFDTPGDGQVTRDNVMKGWAGGNWDASKVINTNWVDLVTQTSLSHEHTLSASGGSEKMSAYASFGYLSNKGTQKGQWYERYTTKVGTTIDPAKWFNLSASINASWSEQDYGISTLSARSGSTPDAIYGIAKSIFNISPPYAEDGSLIIRPGGESSIYTIMDEWDKSTQQTQTFRALGAFTATLKFGELWEPLKGLTYRINFGPDFRHWREGAFISSYSSLKMKDDGSAGVNFARLRTQRDFSWTLDNQINYERTFFEKHKANLLLLQTATAYNRETSSMQANAIPLESALWNAMGSVDLTNPVHAAGMSSDIYKEQMESYLIRLNYNFNDRYLLTLSGRWDGSSVLADNNQWAFFPSAAIAWRINQEEFMKDIKWVDNLKLRLGYGQTGNSSIRAYTTKGDIQSVYLPFNGMDNQIGYTTNEPYYTRDLVTKPDPNLTWERTKQFNVGIDFGFLKNRITGSLDFYSTKTTDLILEPNIPTFSGYSTMITNVGATSNKGVELTLNAIPIQLSTGFAWNTSFNIAYQKDKIDELAYGKNDMPDSGWFIGEALTAYPGYAHNGIWQDTPEDNAEMAKWNANGYSFTPGNVRPKDQNGDYMMNVEDRVVLGQQRPKTTLGWTNNFSYKGLELGINMLGRMGYLVSTGGFAMTGRTNQSEVDYWRPDNTGAEYQKPILGEANSGSLDEFSGLLGFKEASFIKVRNISIGYNFSPKMLKKTPLSNCKLYAQVINPFDLYSSIDWYDLDTNKSYFNRSFVFGLEVSF
ncbi:MAG: TonB-dependent receptor [Mediterranea sp.]|jgi:TonB-linked SusC/RagA family outer membrane protein|nr:TonB-dependent receptor [Mediterranea sp.]